MLARLRSLLVLIARNIFPESRVDPKSFRYLLTKRAVETSVDFVQQHMPHAEPFETREGLYRFAIDRATKSGLFLEFGVHNGTSINAIAGMIDGKVHGFDSFEGLPDDGLIPAANDGGVKWYATKMSLGGAMPQVRPNVTLHKGWFDQVLPGFYREHQGDIALMHVDSDIYSSAKCVFECSADRIKPGTIIVFDEYLNFDGWQRHEHRALVEFAAKAGMQYDFIAYNYFGGAAIKVTAIGGSRLKD